jgi:hypothetical protein
VYGSVTLLKVTARPSSDLRCAFCHGPLSTEATPCRACSTALHDECWDDAGVCPTLGCATWARMIRIIPRRIVASWWLLGAWLTAFAFAEVALVLVIPAFEKMYRETGLCLPALTEMLVLLSQFTRTPLGAFAAVALPSLSVAVFVRRRTSRWLRPALYAATWLLIGLTLLMPFALFLPLCNMTSKL